MLKLTRKVNDVITVEAPEGPITITIRFLDRDRVGIGIDAPRCYTILRAELTKRGGLE